MPRPAASAQVRPRFSNDATLTIGELATQAGVTAEAIRYYEREGVIPRAMRAGAGRYRRYDTTDAQRLRFIRRARDLGFSLDEVRGLLALATARPTAPCAEVNRLAHTHLEAVDEKLARLAGLRAELVRLMDACEPSATIRECGILHALNDAERDGAIGAIR